MKKILTISKSNAQLLHSLPLCNFTGFHFSLDTQAKGTDRGGKQRKDKSNHTHTHTHTKK